MGRRARKERIGLPRTPTGGLLARISTSPQPLLRVTRSLPQYAVISPVRDEERFLATTASSVIAQTHRPHQWVIVDDGSTDATRSIAESYAAEYDWITVIASGARHERARGAPIVEAFNAGRAALRGPTELTVKLDGDLFLPAHYFEWIAASFARDPRAGIVGGSILTLVEGRWERDAVSRHNVIGAAKAYRTDCLEEIGGLRPSMGWDGIDEYAARARGWRVHVLSELPILHYKHRGSKQPWYRARWEEGRGAHYMSYHPAFLAIRAAYRMLVERPSILGGLVLGAGFTYGHLTRALQIDDVGARDLLRQEQRARMRGLLHGARHAPEQALAGGGPALWITGGR